MKSFVAAGLVAVTLASQIEQNAQSKCINQKVAARKACDQKVTS